MLVGCSEAFVRYDNENTLDDGSICVDDWVFDALNVRVGSVVPEHWSSPLPSSRAVHVYASIHNESSLRLSLNADINADALQRHGVTQVMLNEMYQLVVSDEHVVVKVGRVVCMTTTNDNDDGSAKSHHHHHHHHHIDSSSSRDLEKNVSAAVDCNTRISIVSDNAKSQYFCRALVTPELIDFGERIEQMFSNAESSEAHKSLYALSGGMTTLLVSGVSGVGKTSSLKYLASISTVKFQFISPICFLSDTSSFLSEIELNLNESKVFVFDELDELMSNTAHSHSQRLYKHIKLLLQNQRNVIVGVVTSPHTIEAKFKRIFERCIDVPMPSYAARFTLAKLILQDTLQAEQVSKASPGMTPRDITLLCTDERESSSHSPLNISQRTATHARNIAPSVGRRIECIDRVCVGGYTHIKRRLFSIADEWAKQWHSHSPRNMSSLSDSLGVVSGILLHGCSGTGKTLLARAMASNPQLNFITAQSSDIFSRFMGESERNIRELFREARNMKPCVLLLDNLDSMGASRSNNALEDGGVQNRVLSTLLNELDGVEARDGVYLIGTCLNMSSLDSALIRPGRFDSLIEIGIVTSIDERASIIRACLHNIDTSLIDIDRLAELTKRSTGASLHDWCTGAKLNALKENVCEPVLRQHHFNIQR